MSAEFSKQNKTKHMGNIYGTQVAKDQEPTVNKEEEPIYYKGTDKTFHVSDLLRKFEGDPQLDPEYVQQQLISKEEVQQVAGAFLLHNFLTPKECSAFIQISEGLQYEESPLSILSGNFDTSQRDEDTKRIRNSERVLVDIPMEMLSIMNQRIVDFLPQTVSIYSQQWELCRECPINPRFRFNRYKQGHYFKPHMDAGYRKNQDEMTQLTLIVYLNECIDGGQKIFFPQGKKHGLQKEGTVQEVVISPKTGLALVFFQNGELNHRHEGATVLGDVPKYIIRSDICYRRVKNNV